MQAKAYFVLLSEDGLFYESHTERGQINLTRSPFSAKVWDWADDANSVNVNQLCSHLFLGKITLIVERFQNV